MSAPFEWIARDLPTAPLFLTSPHSGETLPPEAPWLRELSESLLLTDVDRFVNELYRPAATRLQVPLLCARTHRYAADLNRYPDDVDADSVEGATNPSGRHPKGFHWVLTTRGDRIMKRPVDAATHEALVRAYHDPFHAEILAMRETLSARFPGKTLHHLDCHSMPSLGTGAHADSGKERPEVCISDCRGRSASRRFLDIVVNAFQAEGFQVNVNDPYLGGRITERHGQPSQGHETIQIELNRKLYMDEVSRERLPSFDAVSDRLAQAIARIVTALR